MNSPRVAFLVHGKASSIEAVRARGLAQQLPPELTHFLWREESRARTAQIWARSLYELGPDVIYVLNTAMPGVPLALCWRTVHGVPFVLDTGDAVYEMARRSGIGAGWRLPALKFFEEAAQRCAATVVVRGTRHREHLVARGVRDVALIRDGYAAPQDVSDARVEEIRRRLGLTGRFVVGLMGSLMFSPKLRVCYGWDLLQALAGLKDLDVVGLIIGDGSGRSWIEDAARRLGVLDRLIFTGRIPYEDVPAYLRLMDIALSTQTNNLPGQVRTTGKLPEYMAAGRFILASRVGEAALVLPEMMLVDYEGEVDLAYPLRLGERIRLLHGHRPLLELRHSLPETARRLCSYEVLSRTCREVVGRVARRPQRSRPRG